MTAVIAVASLTPPHPSQPASPQRIRSLGCIKYGNDRVRGGGGGGANAMNTSEQGDITEAGHNCSLHSRPISVDRVNAMNVGTVQFESDCIQTQSQLHKMKSTNQGYSEYLHGASVGEWVGVFKVYTGDIRRDHCL